MQNNFKQDFNMEIDIVKARIKSEETKKESSQLLFFDAYYLPEGGDSILRSNKDSDFANTASISDDTFNPPWDIRVYCRFGLNKDKVASHFRNLAKWIEEGDFDSLVGSGSESERKEFS